MGNCVSATTGPNRPKEMKPASVVNSIDHLGSGNEDNVTVSSYGDDSMSMHNNATSAQTHNTMSKLVFSIPKYPLGEQPHSTDDRRGSITPSVARSEEADGAVIMGYAEPQAFRILRRENDESSSQALQMALRDDPTIQILAMKTENAPSRRPTALGVPNMQ